MTSISDTKHLYTNGHGSFLCSIPKLKTVQMSFKDITLLGEILLSSKKEWSLWARAIARSVKCT